MELDKIYLGDAYELIKEIPDKSIDLIITDPPYVLETQGAGFFGKKSDEYAMNFKGRKAYTYGGERYVMKEINSMKNGISNSFLEDMCRVMKKINIYIWCSQKQLMQYIDFFVKEKGCHWNLLCWHKSNPIPACGNKYLTDTEYCLFFREQGVKVFGTFDTKRTFYVTNSNMKDKRKYGHPTIKPEFIINNFLVNSSAAGDVIFDPFSGSGTTCACAKKLDRRYIGFEIEKKYYDVSIERLNSANEEGQENCEQLTLF